MVRPASPRPTRTPQRLTAQRSTAPESVEALAGAMAGALTVPVSVGALTVPVSVEALAGAMASALTASVSVETTRLAGALAGMSELVFQTRRPSRACDRQTNTARRS